MLSIFEPYFYFTYISELEKNAFLGKIDEYINEIKKYYYRTDKNTRILLSNGLKDYLKDMNNHTKTIRLALYCATSTEFISNK